MAKPCCFSRANEPDVPVESTDGTCGALDLEEILHAVLKNLPMKDLQRVSRVCTSWNAVVKKIKETRTQLSWLVYKASLPEGAERQIGSTLEVVSAEPMQALLFCTDCSVTVERPHSRLARAAKKEKLALPAYLTAVLPPACQLVGVMTDGVVGTSFDKHDIDEMETVPCAACLLLPHMPGVDVYTFSHRTARSPTSEANEPAEPDASDYNRDVDDLSSIPVDKEVKLILWFLVNPSCAEDKALGYRLLERYKGVVLAGGYVDSFVPEVESDTNSELAGFGIAFCGASIKVSSVLVDYHIKKPAGVAKRLQLLKASNVPLKKSVAFMFACIGRGRHFYKGKENVESAEFHKLFPTTPLFGFFGNGEIGFDCLADHAAPVGRENSANRTQSESNGEQGESDDTPRGASPTIYHSYSTIFVLISFV